MFSPRGQLPAFLLDERPAPERAWQRLDIGLVLATLAVVFAVFHVHLGSVFVSDMDEGTYVYAGQLIARGLVPYRDFLLAHPPAVALLAAGSAWLFGPDLMSARALYMIIVLLATIPLYALVLEISRSRAASLLALVIYTSGMLLIANMGRTFRLEPLMNAFLICAVALRYLRADARGWNVLMGALIAGSLFVKVVAVVPVAMLVLGDLLWERPWQSWLKRWLVAAAGALLVAVPAALWCLDQPHFLRDVLEGQINRPRLELGLRVHYLVQNCMRFPPILVGLAAGTYFVLRAHDARVRGIGLMAVGATVVLVFAFKTFFNYYIVQTLPWIAVCCALAVHALAARWLGRRALLALGLAIALFGVAAPVAYAVVYERTGASHVSTPRQIVAELRSGDGCVYSMYPAFALWSERSVCPWYYQADSLVPRINNWIGDADFQRVFEGAGAVVLYPGELEDYPKAASYLAQHFTRAHEDENWVLWERKPR
jgi:4-amino-4-deoxy-L-arabinose transferase-like glycosyltransferase